MPDISPRKIERAMAEAMKLRAETGDDERLFRDCVEGSTDVFDIIDRLAQSAIADKLVIERGSERLKRIEARGERTRATIRNMIEALELTEALERPLATITLGEGPKSVVVTDQAALPDFYFRRSVDKVALGKDLRAGKEVAGAMLNNGAPMLTIRSR